MKTYGLIGRQLTHSFSPHYFNSYFAQNRLNYHHFYLYPLQDIEEIKGLWSSIPNLVGLNVTIPYKLQIIDYLCDISQTAKDIGAVNVIKKTSKGWYGHNTDGPAFLETLKSFLGTNLIISAIVLGSGGSSKAVTWALKQLDIEYLIVSRSGTLNYNNFDIEYLNSHRLIINTTPLGMYPNVEECPEIPYFLLNNKFYLYDLIYNPEKTLFLNYGYKQGTQTKNGMDMLHRQAELSWEFWTHK